MSAPFSLGNTGSSTGNSVVSTPAVPYRLSIGEFLTNRRDSTTISSTSSLAKLLQERGISAKVYDSPMLEQLPLLRPSRTLPIPSTPPNSPSHSPCPSPPLFEPRVHHSENFLASRPAETFLQEVYGLKPASRNSPEVGQMKMSLVDRLKRLGIARVIKPPETQDHGKTQRPEVGLQRRDSAGFLNAGSNLMAGLRRNQSLPAMIGALGAPVCTQSSNPKMDILKED